VSRTYRVRHLTRYHYEAPVTACLNLARLTPRETAHQQVEAHQLVIDPRPDDQRMHVDVHGNTTTYFSIDTPHDVLAVRADSTVVVDACEVPAAGRAWELSVVPARVAAGDPADLADFVLPSRLVPDLAAVGDLARPSFGPNRPGVEAVLDLLERLHAAMDFDPGVTSVSTPLSDVVESRRGVCQDFAHLMVGALRSVGLAARYVSGYLETDPPEGEPKLTGADASHAWCSVWLRDLGWLDLDPTNGTVPSDRHLTLAWGRDYADVRPLSGVLFSGGSGQELTVEVDVVVV
jgi:transglutaminase-like putative cysteine protease